MGSTSTRNATSQTTRSWTKRTWPMPMGQTVRCFSCARSARREAMEKIRSIIRSRSILSTVFRSIATWAHPLSRTSTGSKTESWAKVSLRSFKVDANRSLMQQRVNTVHLTSLKVQMRWEIRGTDLKFKAFCPRNSLRKSSLFFKSRKTSSRSRTKKVQGSNLCSTADKKTRQRWC